MGRAHGRRDCRHSHWRDGWWRRAPRARRAPSPLSVVQERQARVHLPREVDRREDCSPCLGPARASVLFSPARRRRLPINHICMHEYRHVLNPAAACHVEEAAAHSKVTSAVSSRALLVSSVSRSLSQLAPPLPGLCFTTLYIFSL